MQGFDEDSGDPIHPIPMESWPSHQYLRNKGIGSDYFGRYESHLSSCCTGNASNDFHTSYCPVLGAVVHSI